MNEETNDYSISKLADSTYLVYDKTKNIPTPHYYKSFSAASKKIRTILNDKRS